MLETKMQPTLSLESEKYLLFSLKHWWQLYKWLLSVFLHQRHLLGCRETSETSQPLFVPLNIEISNDLHFCTKNVVLCTLALLKRLWQLAHNIQKIFSLKENISYLDSQVSCWLFATRNAVFEDSTLLKAEINVLY